MDKDTGPLVALDQKDSTNIQKKLGYNLKEQNKRISDNTLNKFKFNYLTGKKGDLYLVDTSQCFHAGSRTSKRQICNNDSMFNTIFVYEKIKTK